ncbi:FAD-dependent oxidoreductase, partial [bacterium]|nr:FAD-dependent oxidoreductase [bacterium]
MNEQSRKFDVIVVGGGHAGCEAASAAARLGCRTVLITQDAKKLAAMSCNPAIGGLAKGHLVREIDALGGIMGVITDRSSIQCRMLNRSKGPAVWSPRVQCDRLRYSEEMVALIRETENLEVCEGEVVDLIINGSTCVGVVHKNGVEIAGQRTVLCGGTFWNAVIHIGEWSTAAGRIFEAPAVGLSDSLSRLGL